MSDPFGVDRSHDPDGAWRITVRGALEYTTVGHFDHVVDGLVVDVPNRVVIDLGAVTFLDSSGIRGLVRARRLVHDQHGDLRCVDLTPAVRRVLEFAGLLELLTGAAASLGER